MKKYNCQVFKIKACNIKGKQKYSIVGYKLYPNVPKELGLYLAVKEGGMITGFNGKSSPCHPCKCHHVVGLDKWENELNLVIMHPIFSIKKEIPTLSITPYIEQYTTPIADKRFHCMIERLLSLYKCDCFADFSIEAADIWGPNSLIPKGYEHIKEGCVQEGDFYFEYSSYINRMDDWVSVDASWSSIKIGSKIKYKGFLEYIGDFKYREDGEVTYGYDPYIIRKIQR